jgi:predicted ATP-dependent serine protease
MLTCAHCGQANPEWAHYCSNCGDTLTQPEGDQGTGTPRGSRKTVTVVFADLVNSTRLGERLDTEALRGVLGRRRGRQWLGRDREPPQRGRS